MDEGVFLVGVGRNQVTAPHRPLPTAEWCRDAAGSPQTTVQKPMPHLPENSSPTSVLPYRHPTPAMNTAARWSASPSHRAPPRRPATPPHATPAMSGCLAPRNPRSPDSAPDVKPTLDSILSARPVRPVSTCDLGGSTMPEPAENFWVGRHP